MESSKEAEKIVSYKECLTEIKKYLLPKATKGSVKSTLPQFLEGLLQSNSSNNQPKTKAEIQWIVVQRCLNLLTELKDGLKAQISSVPTAETLLSIQEQAIVRMMLEIITYWGVIPNLEEGVGLSLEKRSPFSAQIELKMDSNQNKARKLYTCLTGFISLLEDKHELYPLVMSKHFIDIFAILLQLIYSPLYNSIQTPSSIISSPTNGLSPSELEFCKSTFDNFVNKIQPGFLVDNLSLLLSVGAGVKWLQKICGSLLTKLLLRPNGVKTVLEHTLITGSKEISIKSFEKVAELVSSIPSNVSTKEYYGIVGPQIYLLLCGGGGPDLMRASVFIVRKMLKKEPELTRSCILDNVLGPFKRISSQMSEIKSTSSSFIIEASKEEVLVGEEEMTLALDNLSKLVNGKMIDQYILAEIKPIIKVLFQIYNFSINSKCVNIQNKLTEILVMFFRYIDQSSSIFKSLIIEDTKTREEDEASLVLAVKFIVDKDSVQVLKTTVPQDRDYISEAGSIVELMKEFKDDSIAGNFFIQLLNDFISLKKQSKEEGEELSQKYIILLQVLAILSEHLGVRVLQDIVQLCTLIKILLEDKEDEETLSLTMVILDLLLNGEVKIKQEEEILLLDLVDDLDILCGSDSEQIADMASKLKTKITTRDSTWVTDTSAPASTEQYNLQDILKDINDPLIPVRAHGLIMLRRMVLVKDNVTKNDSNLQKILDIFQTQLSDSESYIYLTAVRGLSALADIYPDTIIPLLLQQYLRDSLSEQVRLKLGEALLLITKRCGQMLPKYSSSFMNSFLISCKDPLPSMRASGLSNLAELCKQLHFALQPFIREIIDCVVAIVKTDKDEDVRRGALLVITLLFRGLRTDVFELMADDMKSLFRLLKQLEANDPDEVTRMHAKIALGEVNNIVRSFMNVEQQEVPDVLRIIK